MIYNNESKREETSNARYYVRRVLEAEHYTTNIVKHDDAGLMFCNYIKSIGLSLFGKNQ